MSRIDPSDPGNLGPGDRLVVYGTLLDSKLRGELGVDAHMDPVGSCLIEGQMYDIGSFPGVVEGEGTVRGELYAVERPEVFDRLDQYEGYHPDLPRASRFVRKIVPLIEPDGTAWVYFYEGSISARTRIESGSWRTYRSERGETDG